MVWILAFAVLVYAGLLYLFVTRFYVLREVKLQPSAGDSPYRLARFVHAVLSIAHAFAFIVAIVLPPVWVAMSLAQPDTLDHFSMRLTSNFLLDLSQFPELEATGLSNDTLAGTVQVRATTVNMVQWFLYSVASEAQALLALFVVLHLRNIFATICNGAAFTIGNAQRLKWIGIVLLAAYLLAPAWQYLLWAMVANGIIIDLPGFTLTPVFDPSFRALFLGLVILVLSQVMKEAVQLHDEQRLTI